MDQNWRVTSLVAALLVCLSNECDAGELGRIAAGASGSASASSDSPSDSSSSSSSQSKRSRSRGCRHGSHGYCSRCGDNDDDGDSLFGKVLFAGVTSPFWAPHLAVRDSLSVPKFFPEHPYENSDGGMLADKSPEGAHDSLIVLQGTYGDDFDGLRLFNSRLLMENTSRFGIDTEMFYRTEELATGTDDLWHGDANLTFRFAQSEHWMFRAGLGVNWLATSGVSEAGLNFTYGADWLPADPWVISGVLDWGRVGDAGLFHGRTTVGISKDGWGLFTGYDYFEVDGVDIHSWINGIELRF